VGSLSVAYQQVVEICKCLTRNAEVLVLDEPTAVLTFSEIEKLFSIIRKLKSEGVSVIYISHRLEEIFQLSDSITVLKDGANVATVETASINKEALVAMMVGREITQMFPERHAVIGKEILRVENLNAGKLVKDVSFSVKAGEVVGFSGLVGAGRTETMRAIFGADSIDSGKVVYFGEEIQFKNPKQAIDKGFGLLPEDRKKQGLLLEQSIRVNTTLASMNKIKSKLDIINNKKEKVYVKKILADINTKYGATEDNVNSLSGGNQQKIALAKWLSADCKCIVFDEPTRGVDVGAKTEIYKIINVLAEQGVGIIMISSEMTEVIGMCDRVVIMRQGSVAGEVDKTELTENNLIKYAMGV
jgi:ribose transport system ATP-binding protein